MRAPLESSRASRAVVFLTVGALVLWVALAARGAGAALSGSGAAGRCSKAAARKVVAQLGLGGPGVSNPVGRVLCGAFTGPGSKTMVVSLWGPGNTGLATWAVFRSRGGVWEFLMKQPAAAAITAAGPDIRQTLPIYRPSDPRCCPSGGTKTRIWHWNGSRFVAGRWKRVRPAR